MAVNTYPQCWLIVSQLTPEILKLAYSHGYFPMAEPKTGDIFWYNPDPRAILPFQNFHCSRSLRRTIHKKQFKVTTDEAFEAVMRGCATRAETWISEDFIQVYTQMHAQGWAHSIEVWDQGKLVGGTYGVALGGAFFAESMFHSTTDASKVALFYLVGHLTRCGFTLLEVQFLTPHLQSLGAVEVSNAEYQHRLAHALSAPAVWRPEILPPAK